MRKLLLSGLMTAAMLGSAAQAYADGAVRTVMAFANYPDLGEVQFVSPESPDGFMVTTADPIVMKAVPSDANGVVFVNWTNDYTGEIAGTAEEYTYTGEEDAMFTAHFGYVLNVTSTGGEIIVHDGVNQDIIYTNGSKVPAYRSLIVEVPQQTATLVSMTVDGQDITDRQLMGKYYMIEMGANTTIEAVFEPIAERTVYAFSNYYFLGDVEFVSPESIDGMSVTSSEAITMKAVVVADDGAVFVNWYSVYTDEIVSTDEEFTYYGAEDAMFDVNFGYVLTVNVDGGEVRVLDANNQEIIYTNGSKVPYARNLYVEIPEGSPAVEYVMVDGVNITDNMIYGRYYQVEMGVNTVIDVKFQGSGIESIGADAAEAEYFNMQGVRVGREELTPGVYVKRAGTETVKVVVK